MSRSTTYHTVQGTRIRETDRAVLFEITHVVDTEIEKPKREWFPLSQCEKSFTNPNVRGEDWLMVSEWILQQKGLI